MEDFPGEIEQHEAFIEAIAPKLFYYCNNFANVRVRITALECINQLTYSRSSVIGNNVSEFLQIIGERTIIDKDVASRKVICQSLTALMECYSEEMSYRMAIVMEFMLSLLNDADKVVALNACDFWLALPENECYHAQLVTILPRLLVILLKCMKYDEYDASLIYNEESTNFEHDSSATVKPRHHSSRLHGNIEVQLDDGDDDEQTDDDTEEEWNLRKCAASTFDLISNIIDQKIFTPILLPLLQELLQSEDWKAMESGILAVGAIAEGCMESIWEHLPALMSFVMENIKNRTSKPLIKSISCWCIGKYF